MLTGLSFRARKSEPKRTRMVVTALVLELALEFCTVHGSDLSGNAGKQWRALGRMDSDDGFLWCQVV